MNAVRALSGLGPADSRSTARDPLLRWMVFYPPAMGLALRWLVPPLTVRVAEVWGLDLVPLLPLFATFMLLLGPVLTGMVMGFLVLDQRDDGTLAALSVTPLTWRGYLAYRLTIPTLLSVPMTMLAVWLTGLNSLGLAELALTALAAAPLAPLLTLFLGAFAANKVQGFALVKAQGVVLMLAMLAWWIPMPWQLLMGLSPAYWPAKLYWVLAAGEPAAAAYLLAGLAWQALLVAALARRFDALAKG